MPIIESSKDYGTNSVLILWDGIRPTDDEFIEYSIKNHGVNGDLFIENPSNYNGLINLGTCHVVATT